MIIMHSVLIFFVGVQLYLLVAAVASFIELRRQAFHASDEQVGGLLTSVMTPAVSVLVPAYNEAPGIVEAVKSMALLHYPRFEIIVVNDGSTDDTLNRLREAFTLVPVESRYRPVLLTEHVRAVYKCAGAVPLTVIDKANGGKGDAINAGINASSHPYFLATDADMVLDNDSLLRAIRHVQRDRHRVIAVGGNLRPINGSAVRNGSLIRVSAPRKWLELLQVLEYVRGFLSARPGWSRAGSLVLISGAFGLFRKREVIEVGGYRTHHLGEDLELTMRLHRRMRELGRPYRIVYAPDAVAWTETPSTRQVLRRQRMRWHRGLSQVVREYWSLMFNRRYGIIGMVAWPAFVVFEFISPIIEFLGWITIPLGLARSDQHSYIFAMLLVAYALGIINSVIGLLFDSRFGHYTELRDILRLLSVAIVENLGLRQMTVWWRIRSLIPESTSEVWGDMERAGVANLGAAPQ